MAAPISYHKRLMREYKKLQEAPLDLITALPTPANIREWHYVIHGLTEEPYAGGYFHGKVVFPEQYPMKPPAIFMITPNGRFQVNTRICLSMSDYHPETWNPAWSVSTILQGLLSFMLEETATAGSMSTSHAERQKYAKASLLHNLRDAQFVELFPELTQEIKSILRQRHANRTRAEQSGTGSGSGRGTDAASNPGLGSVLAFVAALVAFVAVLHNVVSDAASQKAS
ncbi:uncharacterized protein MONBRDRAFT_21910 [Monosiga brevicollis MX1]|uniref:E2 ubiquitin-conjugating enzyme n=1 Tax=Monosiga brevicollis TaxID=81824 RepID=A9UNZ3_MONBE|nr:uncharacterized protein MONBRDRAFT_21910 [Monosiga brevicollis MX1]EDQ92329.1 predicted protein [Monosiga brevicollis MX1]|eukprot:XP_001742091.1 hypothetical protein [Monosiga brevicollis MX1]